MTGVSVTSTVPGPGAGLASMEAWRVEEQARQFWNALRSAMGAKHGPALDAARREAAAVAGPLLPDSQPAVRLAHAHVLYRRARDCQRSLAGLD